MARPSTALLFGRRWRGGEGRKQALLLLLLLSTTTQKCPEEENSIKMKSNKRRSSSIDNRTKTAATATAKATIATTEDATATAKTATTTIKQQQQQQQKFQRPDTDMEAEEMLRSSSLNSGREEEQKPTKKVKRVEIGWMGTWKKPGPNPSLCHQQKLKTLPPKQVPTPFHLLGQRETLSGFRLRKTDKNCT